MRALSVTILLATLLLPSGHALASPPIDISPEELQILQRQAAKGDARVQNNLAELYYTGKGVPQDYEKARYLWEQAAGQGVAEAQYLIGALYAIGGGRATGHCAGVYVAQPRSCQLDG